jgi:SAM-dependent methyltransferase
MEKLKLDLACGQNKVEGFKGVDRVALEGVDYVVDLQEYPWPFEDNSVDEIYCSHYIEHIKHDNVALDLKKIVNESGSFEEFKAKVNEETFLRPLDGFIKFVNELYRILKTGGKVTLIAPYYSSMGAFGDPTHVRYINDFSTYYLNKETRDAMLLGHYGIECDFDIKFSYVVSEELSLRSEDVRNEAFIKQLNAVTSIIIELVKR